MKKRFVKLFAVVMAVAMCFSVVACVNGDKNDVVTDEKTVNVRIRKSGVGTSYIYALAEQFEKTFENEGYKVNILSPREDLTSTIVYQDIYSNSGVDVYFVSDIDAGVAVTGDYGQVIADITDSVYKKKAIKFDGTEEDKTIEEKLSYLDMSECFYKDKIYGLPYSLYAGGLAVNKKVLADYGLEIPRTTNEMFATADEIMKKALEEVVFPFTFSLTGNSYVDSTSNTWIAQYGGVEEFNSLWSFENSDGTPISEPYKVYQSESILNALEVIYNFYDVNMAAPGSASDTFSTVQGKIMRGDAVYYSVGNWMLNEEFERYTNYLNDVTFINAPVISKLGTKLFGAGTSYNFSDTDCDKVLSIIVKYADQNFSVEEIQAKLVADFGKEININEIQTVCERRGYVRVNVTPGLIINEKSDKKDLAETFVRFCASDEAGKLFAQEAKTISPFAFTQPIESEYEWINSVNSIFSNRYFKQISSNSVGTRKQFTSALFPKSGIYYAGEIFVESISKYDVNCNIVNQDKDLYLNAAAGMLKKEYDYVKKQFDEGKWKVNG